MEEIVAKRDDSLSRVASPSSPSVVGWSAPPAAPPTGLEARTLVSLPGHQEQWDIDLLHLVKLDVKPSPLLCRCCCLCCHRVLAKMGIAKDSLSRIQTASGKKLGNRPAHLNRKREKR